MREGHVRSIVKSISWRILASLTTIILVFLFTNNLAISLSVGLIEVVAKILIYYLHERVWNNIKWGVA